MAFRHSLNLYYMTASCMDVVCMPNSLLYIQVIVAQLVTFSDSVMMMLMYIQMNQITFTFAASASTMN